MEKVSILSTQNAQLAEENRWFKEQFLLARHRQFGAKSERTTLDPSQLGPLFNEAEAILGSSPKEALEEKTITYTRRKKSIGHREEVLADLRTETIDYYLPEEERICECCGGPLHEMSTKTREELKIVPAQVSVIRHVRHVYACRNCDRNETSTPIVTAPSPLPIIEKSLASPSAIAHIMGMKYGDAMPLYRIEKHFEQFGVEMPRAVLSNWMIKGGELLSPIYTRMHTILLGHSPLHADETTLQVLKEDGRKAQSKSYMWQYCSGSVGPPIVLYEYQPTRDGDHPHRFLSGFKGYLHVDGYAGYNGIPGVILVGCWAHARRKFVEAQKVLPKDERENPEHRVNIALAYIKRLFKIEEELSNATPDERKAARELRSKPITDEFKTWLDVQAVQVLPKSTLGVAVGYCLGQWTKLEVYLTDGRLEISNNRAERSIKPFVIGRKNWLFANTPKGAKTSALIYSIVETAKANGLNPYTYLEYALDHMREIDPNDKSAIDELLPWSEPVKSALTKGVHSKGRS
jgi:transposase